MEYWHLFVNRLFRKGIRIILTGSNSKLLSVEMASYMTGRYHTIELFPYSFSEYLQARKISMKNVETTKERGLAVNYFMEYLKDGCFPEVTTGESREPYVSALFDAIVTRALLTASKELNAKKLTIITLNEEDNIESGENVIDVKPVINWLFEHEWKPGVRPRCLPRK